MEGEETPFDDETVRSYVRTLQANDQSQMQSVLRTLCAACRAGNKEAKSNRATLMRAGGASQLVEMLVDESTTVGQLGPKGSDKHSFTRHVAQILRDLAEQGASDDDASAVHAQMIFVGLPAWLAEYLRVTAEAKRASSGLIGMAGRLPRPQPVWGAVWSGNSRGTDPPTTAALAQQLVLLLAASAAGIEGLLHAGLAQVLAEEIAAAPSELTGAVLAAAAMVLKYHHECTGAVEAARVANASMGDPGYSKLVEVAGRAVQKEAAALVEDIKAGEVERVYMVAAEELVRLSLFSEIFVETVAMKLLPALKGMIRSDHAELVSRASKVLAVVSEDSPDMATVLCKSGLLKIVAGCLTPMRQFRNQMVNHPSAREVFVSPKTRLYLLEMLATISLPTVSDMPHSILLRTVSGWSTVGRDEEEEAGGSAAESSLSDLLDDLTTAFRVEADRSQLALEPLSHFVTVMSFMVLEPTVRSIMAERADLVELLLAHSCINTLGVLALAVLLDVSDTGEVREGALWGLRRIPSLDCAIEEDPAVSLQVVLGLGFLVEQPEFVAYVLGMELVPVLLAFLEVQDNDADFTKTRRESARILNVMLRDTSLQWEEELAELREEVVAAVAGAGFSSEEMEVDSDAAEALQEEQATALPNGWEERVSATTGDRYFVNVLTGESQWDEPVAAAAAERSSTSSGEQDGDRVEIEDARDVSTDDETENESDEEEDQEEPTEETQIYRQHEAAAAAPTTPQRTPAAAPLADEKAKVAMEAKQQVGAEVAKLETEAAAAKRAQQEAEAEVARMKAEAAAAKREYQAQQTAEVEAARLMAEEAAATKRAQQAAEAEAAELRAEAAAAKQAQQAAEAETARLQNEEALRVTTDHSGAHSSAGSNDSDRLATSASGTDADAAIELEFAEAGPLGISFGAIDTGPITVEYVRPGSAAARTGLIQEGMRLLSVNHVPVREAEPIESVLETIKSSARPLWLGLSCPTAPTVAADASAAVVPLQKYRQLQQLVTSLEDRIASLEVSSPPEHAEATGAPSEDAGISGTPQEGMSLHNFLLRYHLEGYEAGLMELGVVVPEHLCDVDEVDLKSMGMTRLELVRFRTACDLLGELDDL